LSFYPCPKSDDTAGFASCLVVKTSARVTVVSPRAWISRMMSSYTLVTAGKLA
jgi:hypothetical protein